MKETIATLKSTVAFYRDFTDKLLIQFVEDEEKYKRVTIKLVTRIMELNKELCKGDN